MIGEYVTDNPQLSLVPIDVERDAPLGVGWLTGATGRETLRLMGVTSVNNQESNLETERKRLREIVANPHEDAWMIRYEGTIVGILEIELEDKQHIQAPAISIMIGDESVRGKDVGTSVLNAALEYLRGQEYKNAYARHLTDNQASAALLAKCGFENDGPTYKDMDDLKWQNMAKELA